MRNNVLERGLANGSINCISASLIAAGVGAATSYFGADDGGGSSSSTEMPAWLREKYTEEGGALDEATRLFEAGGPNYFEGDTVADLNRYQNDAINNVAGMDDTLNPAAGGYAESVLGGDYLGGDQFMDAYGQDILEGVDSRFGAAGRGGSGYNSKVATSELGNAASRLYGDERDRQNQVLGNIPGLVDSKYTQTDKLMNAGSVLQAQDQNEITANVERHDFNENQATDNLDTYMGFLNSVPAGSTTTTQGEAENPLIAAVGGGMSGYSMGSNWGNNSG